MFDTGGRFGPRSVDARIAFDVGGRRGYHHSILNYTIPQQQPPLVTTSNPSQTTNILNPPMYISHSKTDATTLLESTNQPTSPAQYLSSQDEDKTQRRSAEKCMQGQSRRRLPGCFGGEGSGDVWSPRDGHERGVLNCLADPLAAYLPAYLRIQSTRQLTRFALTCPCS